MNLNPIHESLQTDSIESTNEFVQAAIVKWMREAGISGGVRVDGDQPLYELGIDSLGTVEIATELERGSGKKLNPEMLYELETVNEIAEYLDSLPVGNGKAESARTANIEADLSKRDESIDGFSSTSSLLSRYQMLNRRVDALKEDNRYFFEPVISEHDGAWVVADGKRMLMLSSYEYLGLLGNQRLKDAAIETIRKLGTGHHGSRILTGTTTCHRQLEEQLAAFMHTEDAIVFSSGYVTNLAVISALVGPGDRVIGDQWNHASIVDGCRMSGADFMSFDHNDVDSLEKCLQQSEGFQTLVVVDAIFSMDGDIAPVRDMIGMCQHYNALLMVDEAHSLGVLGETGRGIQEHFGLDDHDIDIKMGTLSKTLASSGGFVAASSDVVRYLRHHARGYIFSGALAASQAHAAMAALKVMQDDLTMTQQLWRNVELFSTGLRSAGFDIGHSVTPIVPIMTGDIETALRMTQFCRQEGLLLVPVCYPAVPMDAPRLRTCVSASHTGNDIGFALDVLRRAGREAGLIA